MENNMVKLEGLLILGKNMKSIQRLAIVGAVSIVSGITYVSYKLGQRFAEKKHSNDSIKNCIG